MAENLLESTDYLLGRGKLLFQPDEAYTGKFQDFGNAPQFNLTIEVEKLEHYSSRVGGRVKDKEVFTQKDAKGQIIVDDPRVNNVKKFLLSDTVAETAQSSATGNTKDDIAAGLDTWQEIGEVDLSSVVVKDVTDVTTYTEGVDYEIDYAAGLIRTFSAPVSIVEDDILHITYDCAVATIQTIDGLVVDKITGHLYFVGNPATGRIIDIKGYCSLTPSGDLAQISENEWTVMTFDVEFLKHATYTPAIVKYIDRGVVA